MEACRDKEAAPDPRKGVARKLTVGEMERLWKTDRRTLAEVNSCFERIVCQYHQVRKEIGRVEEEPLCVPTEEELRNAVPNIRKGRREPIPKHQKRLE